MCLCVCSSVSYSSQGTAKYQIALIFVPRLAGGPAAEESYQHSVLWRMCVRQLIAEVTSLFIRPGNGGSLKEPWYASIRREKAEIDIVVFYWLAIL